jgi:hypothetical protein
MKQSLFYLLLITLIWSCNTNERPNAQAIVDKAIEVTGGEKFDNSVISFDFRGRHYKATRNNGLYTYSREFKDSIKTVKDVLSNNGFKRFINGELIKVADSMVPRYSASVNSVHYFSVLPFGLNDAAVNKEYLGAIELNGNNYHKIKVHFNEEGGGEDFEDVFVYWVDKESFKVDYIAYSYEEGRGLGLRFRRAYNERYVNGVRFVDYENYKPETVANTSLYDLDKLFIDGELKLLSKIENENIKVE